MQEFWFPRGNSHSFRHHAASAESTGYGPIALTRYSGPLVAESFVGLRELSRVATPGAIALHRLDFSLPMVNMNDLLARDDAGTEPEAIVVHDDQYNLWSRYSDAMWERGQDRRVFRRSQIGNCQDWVFSVLAGLALSCPA